MTCRPTGRTVGPQMPSNPQSIRLPLDPAKLAVFCQRYRIRALRRRRTIRVVAWSLLFGVACTWVVAWGSVLFSPRFVPDYSSAPDFDLSAVLAAGSGEGYRPSPVPDRFAVWATVQNELPCPALIWQDRLHFTAVAGWPVRALGCDWAQSDGNGSDVASGIRVSSSRSPVGVLRLPLRPIWPGVAVNVLLFGTIGAVMTILPSAVRRARRRRRGACTLCGYDVRGLLGAVCPECGERSRNT